ncbi:MAG: cysteine desulfurase [Thermoanaerobaculia bacterium]|jgi:cysteine desulfurase/selenocysteine lyase
MPELDEVKQAESASAAEHPFAIEKVRQDFPALSLSVHGKPLVYLDNAASTQKPLSVLDAADRCYREYYSNVHRGVHYLSQKATDAYEEARCKVQAFLGAARSEEIVFVRGATEGINLVASTFGRSRVKAGDEVLITEMEHHSNIVPWQMLCGEVGATLRVAPIDDRGEVILEEYEKLINERTRLVAMVYISNALGTINPVARMIEMAHARDVPVLVDGAQAVPHKAVDVQALDCDFFVFSGHKMFGPTGIGALYGKLDLLTSMPPYQGGGEMIRSVTFAKTDYADPPARFEAGTPNIVGAIAMGAAVDYLQGIGLKAIGWYESGLLDYATEVLSAAPGVRLVGTATHRASVVSFVIDGVHPHDAGTILDREGIAVRAGHHCAQPVMDHFGVPATVRASLALYNTRQEIDRLVSGVAKVKEIFS